MLNQKEKRKITNLFEFLKQYNNIKNPVITNIEKQEWYRWVNDIQEHENIKNNIYAGDRETDVVLSVSKPQFVECPQPPDALDGWILKGWSRYDEEIKVKKNIVIEEKDKTTGEEKIVTLNFEDESTRIREFAKWKSKRDLWVEKEKRAHAVDEIFNTLFSLYSILKRESESKELILGDGILKSSNGNSIYHPILLQKVELKFDANIPEFKIQLSDKSPELYKSLLTEITEPNMELLIELYKEFEKEEFLPIEVENTNSFLNRIVHALSPEGKFFKNEKEIVMTKEPIIFRKPVLFMRKINMGFATAIESIIDDVNESEEIPSFLKEIVGIDEQVKVSGEQINNENRFIASNGLDENILLTKPANKEQLTVAKYLETHGAVLVQGPPGTGKTHTIANMVGHLLSQGKSILIT